VIYSSEDKHLPTGFNIRHLHADNKHKLLVYQKGLLNTFIVDMQLILGCDSTVVPIVNKEVVSCAVDVFQKTYPNL
jgi:hypothetical protein